MTARLQRAARHLSVSCLIIGLFALMLIVGLGSGARAQPGYPIGKAIELRKEAFESFAPAGPGAAPSVPGLPPGLLPPDQEFPDEEPKTPAEAEAQQIVFAHMRQEKVQRRPEDILRALSQREQLRKRASEARAKSKGKLAPPEEMQVRLAEFQLNLVIGDWDAVRAHLEKFPAKSASRIYDFVLDVLIRSEQLTILPSEILPLADASPAELSVNDLDRLGQLMRLSLASSPDKPAAVLAELRQGTRRLGGTDPKRKLSAARLLLGAGLLEDGRAFLPPWQETLASKDPSVLNLQAAFQELAAQRDQDPKTYAQAWDLGERVLALPDAPQAERLVAIWRSARLLDHVAPEVARAALVRRFRDQSELGMLTLDAIGSLAHQAGPPPNGTPAPPGASSAPFRANRLAVDALLGEVRDLARWKEALTFLALAWLQAADQAAGIGLDPNEQAAMQQMYYRQQRARQRMMMNRSSPYGIDPFDQAFDDSLTHSGIAPEDLLASAPGADWQKQLAADLAQRIRMRSGVLAIKAQQPVKAMGVLREIAASSPAEGKALAEQFVQSLPTADFGNLQHGNGIPLTRARQVRALASLAGLLNSFRELPLPPLGPEGLVQAFARCHSPAEIYLQEDVVQVFGDPDTLRPPLQAALAADLRGKLAQQWRAPELQERFSTGRTDKELVAELLRGYRLAQGLIGQARQTLPQDCSLMMLDAMLRFDFAEFQYGQKVDLATYAKLRDDAFATFAQAAKAYAADLPLDRRGWNTAIHQAWFRSALGASDLGYLTRQDQPDRDQIDRVAQALGQLPPEAVEAHRAMFGNSLMESLVQLAPNLKPWYLREGVRVLGDHPSGQAARERLRHYDDLLHEVELHLAVDGSTNVGTNARFGLRLSMRSTQALSRESGSFLWLLYTQSQGGDDNARKKLESSLRDATSKGFELETVRFCDPSVQPRGFGRPGWTHLPLAYCVLRAKGPSVDRIPPVQLDLTFRDLEGEVLLPVTSAVALIDAKSPPVARPVKNMRVRQVLDDAKLDAGLVRLEITANAHGLIGDLDQVLVGVKDVPWFRLQNTNDQGHSITNLDATEEPIQPLCERTWVAEYAPAVEAPPAFAFLKPVNDDVQIARLRYVDADLVDAPEMAPLAQPLLSARSGWKYGLGALTVILLFFAARWIRRVDAPHVAHAGYERPESATPFQVLGLLERIQGDALLALSSEDRAALRNTIAELEKQYFARKEPLPAESAEGSSRSHLEGVLDHWLARALNGQAHVNY